MRTIGSHGSEVLLVNVSALCLLSLWSSKVCADWNFPGPFSTCEDQCKGLYGWNLLTFSWAVLVFSTTRTPSDPRCLQNSKFVRVGVFKDYIWRPVPCNVPTEKNISEVTTACSQDCLVDGEASASISKLCLDDNITEMFTLVKEAERCEQVGSCHLGLL